MVLMLTFNSTANSESLRPLLRREKILRQDRIGKITEILGPKIARFGLAMEAQITHKARMDKHSRAFGRSRKGKGRRLPSNERKQPPGKQVVSDPLVELATD